MENIIHVPLILTYFATCRRTLNDGSQDNVTVFALFKRIQIKLSVGRSIQEISFFIFKCVIMSLTQVKALSNS